MMGIKHARFGLALTAVAAFSGCAGNYGIKAPIPLYQNRQILPYLSEFTYRKGCVVPGHPSVVIDEYFLFDPTYDETQANNSWVGVMTRQGSDQIILQLKFKTDCQWNKPPERFLVITPWGVRKVTRGEAHSELNKMFKGERLEFILENLTCRQ